MRSEHDRLLLHFEVCWYEGTQRKVIQTLSRRQAFETHGLLRAQGFEPAVYLGNMEIRDAVMA